MTLSQQTRDAIIAAVGRVLRSEEWELWLYGSFARGEGHRGSDIDLAVRAQRPISRADEARIVAELEESVPTLRELDLVDLEKAPNALRARIMEEGQRWHPTTT